MHLLNKQSSQRSKQSKFTERDRLKQKSSEISDNIYKSCFLKSALASSYVFSGMKSKSLLTSSIFGSKQDKHTQKSKKNVKNKTKDIKKTKDLKLFNHLNQGRMSLDTDWRTKLIF